MSITKEEPSGPVLVTRQEAIASKSDTYFTGRPCKYGHIAGRWLRNGDCTECNKERANSWHFANHTFVKERLKRHYQANRSHRLSMSAKWKAANHNLWVSYGTKWKKANPEKVIESTARYLQSHLPEHRAKEARRRAIKVLSTGVHTASDVAEIQKSQRFMCAYCSKSTKRRYHVDHIVPLVLGGQNGRSNLQILCPTCNLRKGGRHPIEFAQRLGRLL